MVNQRSVAFRSLMDIWNIPSMATRSLLERRQLTTIGLNPKTRTPGKVLKDIDMSIITDIATLESLANDKKWKGDYVGAYQVRTQLEEIYAQKSQICKGRVQNLNQLVGLAVRIQESGEALRFARTSAELSSDLTEATKANSTMLYAAVLAENRLFNDAVIEAKNAIAMFESLLGVENEFVCYRKRDLVRMQNGDTGPYLDL